MCAREFVEKAFRFDTRKLMDVWNVTSNTETQELIKKKIFKKCDSNIKYWNSLFKIIINRIRTCLLNRMSVRNSKIYFSFNLLRTIFTWLGIALKATRDGKAKKSGKIISHQMTSKTFIAATEAAAQIKSNKAKKIMFKICPNLHIFLSNRRNHCILLTCKCANSSSVRQHKSETLK